MLETVCLLLHSVTPVCYDTIWPDIEEVQENDMTGETTFPRRLHYEPHCIAETWRTRKKQKLNTIDHSARIGQSEKIDTYPRSSPTGITFWITRLSETDRMLYSLSWLSRV